MRELQMHDGFIAWLQKNHLAYIRARPDQKSTIREGWPDFTVLHCNRSILIEVKTPKGTLSDKQKKCIADLRKESGIVVLVCRSVEECVNAVKAWLGDAVEQKVFDARINAAFAARDEATAPGWSPSAPEHAPAAATLNPDLYVADWSGQRWLIEKRKGSDRALRLATAEDVLRYPIKA